MLRISTLYRDQSVQRTDNGLDNTETVVPYPARVRAVPLHQTGHIASGVSYSLCSSDCLPGGSKADQSPPSRVHIMQDRKHSSTHPYTIMTWTSKNRIMFTPGKGKPLYRPGQALRVPRRSDPQISGQWAHGGGEVSPKRRPPLPPTSPGNIPGTHFC